MKKKEKIKGMRKTDKIKKIKDQVSKQERKRGLECDNH